MAKKDREEGEESPPEEAQEQATETQPTAPVAVEAAPVAVPDVPAVAQAPAQPTLAHLQRAVASLAGRLLNEASLKQFKDSFPELFPEG